jgi:GNAT superfamily N-acetyltransferase
VAEVSISTLADRPQLIPHINEMPDTWPEFMRHDQIANALLEHVVPMFPHLCVVATDEQGTVVARGLAVAFRLWLPERAGVLPAGGWDQVLAWAVRDNLHDEPVDAVSALEIAVEPRMLGQGLSGRMLDALRTATSRAGLAELVAPVRPSAKHQAPRLSMSDYLHRTRSDGLPEDPWLRVHMRVGARVDRIAPVSMVIAGALAEWRAWTGLPFDTDGSTEVPGALAPVQVDVANDHAVYVEPNVWVRHQLTAPTSS